MSDRNFSRRRRGGMRFRPPGGLNPNQKPDRAANEARADALGEKSGGNDPIYDKARHEQEIERAENVAAGLPPQGIPPAEEKHEHSKKDFREPDLKTPAEVQETAYQPVKIAEPAPQGIVETIRVAATKVMKKVQQLIRPVKRTNKEV